MKLQHSILWWIFGIVFVVGGFAILTQDFIVGSVFLLAGLICLPNIRQKISNKTGFNFGGWKVVAVIFVLFTVGGILEEKKENLKAQNLGFLSAVEYKEALKNGITDSTIWEQKKIEIALAKRDEEIKEQELAKQKAISEKQAKAKAEEECRNDINCWASRNMIEAEAYCQSQIERFAKYEVKWTDGITNQMFDRAKWKHKKNGIITFYGDQVKFQNGFGAYENYVYSCDYDTLNKKADNVNVAPGRL